MSDWFDLSDSIEYIVSDLKFVRSVLDVGCGKDVLGFIAKRYFNVVKVVGVDGFEPYVNSCLDIYDRVVLCDLVDGLPFSDKSFDVVFCCHVIEHLNRSDGLRLIKECMRVGRKVVFITPVRFNRSVMYDFNYLQLHKSLWCVDDFKKLGFKVRGFGRFSFFGRDLKYLSFVFSFVGHFFPNFSSSLYCVNGGE